MTWIQGELQPDGSRLAIGDRSGLHCGEGLDLKVQGQWLRGRIEADGNGRWYWTDNTIRINLRPGLEVRQWDGRGEWPRPGYDRTHEGPSRGR